MPRPKKQQPRRTARQPRAPKVTEKTLGESIIEQMQEVNAALKGIQAALFARNAILSVVTSETEEEARAFLKQVEETGKDDPPATAAEIDTALAPLKKKRGRPSKAELAARNAAEPPGSTTLAQGAEGEPESVEAFKARMPKMCACGVREDLPPHLHGKGCPVHAPAEAPPAHRAPEPAAGPLSLDDVRGVAIAFVGKHGKEKLSDLLKKYSADKLTSVPADKLPALMSELQAGV